MNPSEQPRVVLPNDALATKVLDLMTEIVDASDVPMPVHFETLTAAPGVLPRLMLTVDAGTTQNTPNYISGEVPCPFPCALTLRIAAQDEQERLDAEQYLRDLTNQFLKRADVLGGFVAYRKPAASMPYCLGRTNAFEDWRVTFDLNYIKQR